jgi:NADH-quinone oxidoreductase subunit J
MTGEQILFYLMAAGAVISAALMILPPFGRNPIHSAIALISSFFFLAGIYAQLSAHLLTALQIIVYAGAVMVLFSFVIMLLNLQPDEIQEPRITIGKVLATMLGLFVVGKVVTVVTLVGKSMPAANLANRADYGSVKEVGHMMYTSFAVPFELVSVLLLVAAVGAVVLAKKSLRYVERPVPPPATFDREHAHKHEVDTAAAADDHGHH